MAQNLDTTIRPHWYLDVVSFANLEGWLTYPQGTDGIAVAFMGGGVGIAGLLMIFENALYLVAPTPASVMRWQIVGGCTTCGVVSSSPGAAKLIILRYGGIHAYRRAIPFFLGLALGDCITGSLGSISKYCSQHTHI